MAYIKFETRALGHERWLDVTPEAFTVHVWALDYCNEQMTDGFIPERVARRLICPVDPADIPTALDGLLQIGAWVRVERGYFCPAFLAHGLSADEQTATQRKWSEDKRRQRLCRVGVHELCTPRSKCPAVGRGSGQVESSPPGRGAESRIGGRPDQTRPDPTPKGEGRGDGAAENDAGASLGAPEVEDDDKQPVEPYESVGDCPHMTGGLDAHRFFAGRIRCKQCRALAEAEHHRRGLEQARAELDRQRAGESA